MGENRNHDWAKAAASALDWWNTAGVDLTIGDAAFDWLAEPEPEEAAETTSHGETTPQPAPKAVAAPLVLPMTLPEFLAWRVSDAAPEAGWNGRPIAPTGPSAAELMILSDHPDRDDHGTLFSGENARLFDRMLAAIGVTRADVQIASVATVRPLAGRVSADIAATLNTIARHHVAIAAPKRVLTLGNAASRALLPADAGEPRGRIHLLEHKGGTSTEVVATYHPRTLRERVAFKAEAWRDLQLLIGGRAS